MEHISKDIEDLQKEIDKTLQAKQKWLSEGYTVVPNRVFEFSLSSQAIHLFLLLLRRLFQKDYCFPGNDTLGEELNLSEPMVIKYKKELISKKFLIVKRRGQGKTNKYFLNIPELD